MSRSKQQRHGAKTCEIWCWGLRTGMSASMFKMNHYIIHAKCLMKHLSVEFTERALLAQSHAAMFSEVTDPLVSSGS